MSDWDDWTREANDDDLLDYSIQQEKKIPPRQSGGPGCGCLFLICIGVLALIGGIATLILKLI